MRGGYSAHRTGWPFGGLNSASRNAHTSTPRLSNESAPVAGKTGVKSSNQWEKFELSQRYALDAQITPKKPPPPPQEKITAAIAEARGLDFPATVRQLVTSTIWGPIPTDFSAILTFHPICDDSPRGVGAVASSAPVGGWVGGWMVGGGGW